MKSHVEVIIDTLNHAYSNALRISSTHHTENDVKAFLKEIGSAIELFLKEAFYENKRNRDDFYELIKDLVNFGVSRSSVKTLQKLRDSYNKAKHNPRSQVNIISAMQILPNIKTALIEISNLNVGLVNDPKTIKYQRVVWIAGWDHYTTGETEIAIIVPYEHDGTRISIPTFEHFNIHWEGWNSIIKKLSAKNSLLMGKDHLPENFYNYVSGLGEFIEAGVFSGDYRELIIEISKYVDKEMENKLLPDLQRKNDLASMFYAVMYASSDIIDEGKYSTDIEAMRQSVNFILEHRYAASTNSENVSRLVLVIINLFNNLKPEHTTSIQGPIFVHKEKYEHYRKKAYIEEKELKVLVTNDGEFIAQIF
ncbi:hypothetical protein [Peribacillus simplex]|uniref:hypothetical protein n=1 Tax=Peribacillus simplex TaxID=1478 RepID=UPI0033382AC8